MLVLDRPQSTTLSPRTRLRTPTPSFATAGNAKSQNAAEKAQTTTRPATALLLSVGLTLWRLFLGDHDEDGPLLSPRHHLFGGDERVELLDAVDGVDVRVRYPGAVL